MPPDPGDDGRRVVHVNITDFMAQAEESRDSSLRGRPFGIGSFRVPRAVLLGVSRTAFAGGLRPGMDIREAKRRCRDLSVVEPDYGLYAAAEAEILGIAAACTPRVENPGGGHYFLDIRGTRLLFGPAEDCANRIRSRILERTGLKPAVALAVNKLVSKVGSRVVKPYGYAAIRPGDERNFLDPQSVALLPGVGRKIGERLALLGVDTVGDLADFSDGESAALGPGGLLLRDRARGIDFREIDPAAPGGKVIADNLRFDPDSGDPRAVAAALLALAEDLGLRLREDNLTARLVVLSGTYTDGMRAAFRQREPEGLGSDGEIASAVLGLLGRVMARRVRLRGLRLELRDPAPAITRLDLFAPEETARKNALQRAVDRMRLKYGPGAVRRCAALAT